MSVIAATLAASGVNPLTGERIFTAVTVKKMLSIMFSCGMYDYSG
jgi:glutaminase